MALVSAAVVVAVLVAVVVVVVALVADVVVVDLLVVLVPLTKSCFIKLRVAGLCYAGMDSRGTDDFSELFFFN